jgi:hypothetical protein
MKKMKLIFLVFVLLLSYAQVVAQEGPTVYRLGSLTHTVTIERQIQGSLAYTVTDKVTGMQNPVLAFTLTASFTANSTLGNLCITLSSTSAFVPSGELELRVSESKTKNIYGKVSTKTVSGIQSASITYFEGLDGLAEFLSGEKEATIRCTLYSRKGVNLYFDLPADLFRIG